MRYFTSESVTEGHPDKVADRISDSVLDALLALDPGARVACETMVTSHKVILGGEVAHSGDFSAAGFEETARAALRDIGYTDPHFRPSRDFHADTVPVEVLVNPQSTDIAAGVVKEGEPGGGGDPLDLLGAGDQGLMFGCAVSETEELMPAPIQLAHRLAERLSEVRRTGALDYLRPDGKTQVTVAYENDRPVRAERVLISAHHAEEASREQLESGLAEHVLMGVGHELIDDQTELVVNPSGRFVIGGPQADAGLTGRKIIVDTYGGYARHGGGAFSGKDPTKVDRSAAYYARYAAKNVVAAGLAERCEIQVAYAIGKADPFSVDVETFGTSTIDPDRLRRLVKDAFDFRPAAVIEQLNLRRPIYARTAVYGHFGRAGFPWESTDRVDDLVAAAG